MGKSDGSGMSKSILMRSLKILPRRDRTKIVLVAVVQIVLSFLDLVAVGLIGILGSIALTGIQSGQPGDRVSFILRLIHLNGMEFQKQVAILALISAFLLISRTVFSVVFIRRIFLFLSIKGAEISSNIASRLLSSDLLTIKRQPDQDLLYQLTLGVNAISLGILGNATTLLADGSLLLILMIGLFIVDPVIAISSFVLFGGLGLFLYINTNKKARSLGEEYTRLSIQSNQEILEVLSTYRETLVRNRRFYYSQRISATRHKLSSATAALQFMPHIGKYIIESGIVLGAILVSGIQFWMQDATHAVATLSVFLASGTRIAPAIMRIQNGALSFKSQMSGADSTLKLIQSLSHIQSISQVSDELETVHKGFSSNINVVDAKLIYPSGKTNALSNVNLHVSEGEFIAIVGPSGAGKTSLVDVLLGVIPLESGSILISGVPPLKAISEWPGSISYVPQDVAIANSTIKENVSLGFPSEEVSEKAVWEALAIAQLDEYVQILPEKIETQVGERGAKLSGGQRQRLGIARAMYTKPKLLVLDEATSSLDGQTESDISGAIQNLRGNVTVVMIAHRLSTVRNADKVVYMKDGTILAVGTFEEVRGQVPDFDSQASLMGL
jgi:ABC-type multidrug transport system fused ATPase/permease subunit